MVVGGGRGVLLLTRTSQCVYFVSLLHPCSSFTERFSFYPCQEVALPGFNTRNT